MAIFLCNAFKISSTCKATYGVDSFGPIVAQVLANVDVGGFDDQVRGIRKFKCITRLYLSYAMLRFLTDELQDAEDAGNRGNVDVHFIIDWFLTVPG